MSPREIAPRPFTLLRGAEQAWGRQVWRQIDRARERWIDADAKGRRVPWSSWCYVPRELVTHALLGDEAGPDSSPRPITLSQLATTTALAAWRMGKPLYRYDPTLYDALRQTPLTDVVLPAEVFTRLPHWGVYIETPDLTIQLPSMGDVHTGSVNAVGLFAALDDAPQRSTMFGRAIPRRPPRLIIVLDVEEWDGMRSASATRAPVPIQVTLDRDVLEGLTDGWMSMIGEVYAPYLRAHPEEARRQEREAKRVADALAEQIAPLMTLILYLCSEQPDLSGVPAPPEGVAAGAHNKLIAAHNITEWMVGSRIGAALRAGAPAGWEERTERPGNYPLVRPHMRRAHWHTFWTGPRNQPENRVPRLRWLPPIPVAVTWDDVPKLPSDIHTVKLWEPPE